MSNSIFDFQNRVKCVRLKCKKAASTDVALTTEILTMKTKILKRVLLPRTDSIDKSGLFGRCLSSSLSTLIIIEHVKTHVILRGTTLHY